MPSQVREDLLALKSGAVFVCARRDGDIRPGDAGEGLHADDTRHLSELRLTLGGHQPVLLSSVLKSGHEAIVNAAEVGEARVTGSRADADVVGTGAVGRRRVRLEKVGAELRIRAVPGLGG